MQMRLLELMLGMTRQLGDRGWSPLGIVELLVLIPRQVCTPNALGRVVFGLCLQCL